MINGGFMKFMIFIVFMVFGFSIYGAGYTLPIYGYYDMARGGASVVKSYDLTANVINPANIINIKGISSFIGLGVINTSGTAQYYDRGINNDNTRYDKVIKNSPDSFLNPIIAVSDDFGLKKFNFSISLHGPYAPDYKYNKRCSKSVPSCPNRYSLYESDITLANLQFSIAYKVLNNLSVGIGIKESYINFKYDLDLINSDDDKMILLTEESKKGNTDTNLIFDVTDKYNFNVLLGMNYKLNDNLSMAFTYQSPISVDADGTMEAKIYDSSIALTMNNTEIVGNDLNVKLNLPHIMGAGILFEIENKFNIELDLNVEFWSVHDKIVITPKNVKAEYTVMGNKNSIELSSISQKKNWKNTYNLSLGGDYLLLNGDLILSVGGFYETGAIPDEYFDVSIVDSDKFGFGTGFIYRWNDLAFNFSASYIKFLQRDIKNSKVHPGNALKEDYPEDFIVGNGKFDTDIIIFSSGVAWNF